MVIPELRDLIGDVSVAVREKQICVGIGGNLKAKDKYRKCKTWQCKVRTIGIYHAFLVALRKDSVRKTARYFGISIGMVSESLQLFKYVKHMEKIKTRKEALDLLKANRT